MVFCVPQFLLHFVLHFGCFRRFYHRCRLENTGLRRWRKILPLPPSSLPARIKNPRKAINSVEIPEREEKVVY